MTWKQFVRRVEQKIDGESIDLDRVIVDIRYIDVSPDISDDITVKVHTRQMPKRCEIEVYS